jgi:outer membrane protein TolC
MAERHSPSLSAAIFNEIAARKSICIALAAYSPIINAEVLDSAGFPGSNDGIGIEGLMGSPFRKGPAGGVVAKQVLFDFGRTFYNVETAKHEAESASQNTRITIYQVKQLTLQLYYECTKYRTLQDVWGHLSNESAVITKEAQHFVNTGQVSIVDRYLSRAETERAITAHAFFSQQLEHTIRELSILTGIPSHTFTCPRIPREIPHSLNPYTPIDQSPILSRAIADAKAAKAKLKMEKAGFMPKIVALASVGNVHHTEHVKRSEYSLGVGLIVPLFNLEVDGRIKRASAIAAAKNEEVCAQKLFLEEENSKYDRIIHSYEERLKHLYFELNLAQKAYTVAKKRYFTLEGNLIDLRDAFRNLSRVEADLEDTRTILLQAKGSKALLNGSSID